MEQLSRVYASLSADVVDSTSLSVADLKRLHMEIRGVLQRIDEDLAPVWGRVIRGDTIECITSHPSFILRMSLALKCYLKYWLSTVDSSQFARTVALRCSIGIGTMREVDLKDGFLDGEAIYMSGRNLDDMRRDRYSAFDCETSDLDFVDLIDVNVALVDSMINDLSAKQAIVLYYKMLHVPETVIAKELALSQPAVNLRASSGKWGLINRALVEFENLNFEKYVR